MPSIKDFDKKKKKLHKKPDMSKAKVAKAGTVDRDGVNRDEVENDQVTRNESRQLGLSEPIQKDFDFGIDDSSNIVGAKAQQRRPSKLIETETQLRDMSGPNQNTNESPNPVELGPESYQSFSDPDPFELEFPGSFLLKAKAPKTFSLAERIAGDWINDRDFEALPIGHPLAQIIASKALVKAKSLEKNMLNSTPIALAKMGLEYAKSKIKR